MGKRIRWTDEALFNEGQKYQTRKAFQKMSNKAYQAARYRGILDQVCAHMKSVLTSWTNEMIREEALKYETRKAFEKGSVNARAAAQRRGILDQVCAHMKPARTVWSDEMISGKAQKYETRKAFEKGSPKAYSMARHRGILDQVCAHMKPVYTTWADEVIAEEAQKYGTRKAFQKGSRNAYQAAQRRGILDRVCAHMPAFAGHNEVSPTRLYWYLHPEGFCYIGISSDWETRHDQHCENQHNEYAQWIAEQQSPEYWEAYVEYNDTFAPVEAPRRVMERAERLAIQRAVKDGWKVVNKLHNPQYDFSTGTYEWENEALDAIAA